MATLSWPSIMSNTKGTTDTVSQALANANPNASQVVAISGRKTKISQGAYYKIVWRNVIQECRVEKLVQDEEGAMVYFSLASEKMMGERPIYAYGSIAFKAMLLSGGETEMEL